METRRPADQDLEPGDRPYSSSPMIGTLFFRLRRRRNAAPARLTLGRKRGVEKLESAGYTRSVSVFDPGYYSSRGDVLDIYPIHFRNPFRISFNYDRIETISIYDPLSQLTIKTLKTLSFRDIQESSQVINNIELVGLCPDVVVFSVSRLENGFVLSQPEENERIDLGFSPVVFSDVSKKTRLKKVSRLSKMSRIFILLEAKQKRTVASPEILVLVLFQGLLVMVSSLTILAFWLFLSGLFFILKTRIINGAMLN